jgi:hypothetical protein
MPYTDLIETKRPMTLETANLIWTACYQGTAADTAKGWATYTSAQRLQAIAVRQDAHDGQYGIWNISDRH